MCVHIQKEIYYKELAHAIMEAGKSESAVWVGQQAEDLGEPMTQIKSTGCLLENSPLLRKAAPFVLVRPSTD